MWVNHAPLDESWREKLEPLLVEFDVEALWQIGSRSRNDFTESSDWDFMIIFRRFLTKRHAQFETHLKAVFQTGASALTVFHVLTVLPPEQAQSVIRDAIPLWKLP